jgi:hypothetical protein
MRRRLRTSMFCSTIALSLATASIGTAHADAIDGDWCHGAAHLNIDGSTILTPGRNTIQGFYNRYRFAYTVPAGEPGAGGEVSMMMIRGQELVHLQSGGSSGEPEVWRRCKPIS